MFKHLLTLAAAAVVSLGASAGILWQSESEEGVLVDWGQPCVAISADEVVQAIVPGDIIKVTTTGVTEGGWPQVALFGQYGGWPPLTYEGVGNMPSYPYVSSFPVTYELYNSISAEGLSVSGNGAYVGKVEIESSGVEVGPNTVWFGNKECNWGNSVNLPALLFADVKAGDKLIFWTNGPGYQVILGGWSGLNLPCYYSINLENGFLGNVNYEDGVATYTMVEEYATTTEYQQEDGSYKELNVFDLMKENGVIMHGPVTITRIDYVPASEVPAGPQPLYTAVGHATIEEGWEEGPYHGCNFAPAADVNVEIFEDNTIRLNAWAGVEGYDIIVKYDDSQNITSIISVVDGEEYEPVTEGYAYLNTGEQWVYAWVGESYCYANSTYYEDYGSYGYTLLTCSIDNSWKYYYIQWPLTAEELRTEIMAAYDEDIATIQEWYNAMAELDELYPFYGATEAGDAVLAEISSRIQISYELVAAALEAASTSWGYQSPLSSVDVTAMNELIIGAVADCEEMVQAILEAYNTDVESVNELISAYTELIEAVEEIFPGYLNLKEEEFAQLYATIEELNAKVQAALEAAYETGVYEGLSGSDISAAYEQFMSLYAASEEVTAAIYDGYSTDLAMIDEYKAKLQGLIEGDELSDESRKVADEIDNTLNELASLVEGALAIAIYETGLYESPINEEAIAALDALFEAFKTTGISGIEADAAGAIYFGINGQQIQTPAAGQTVIKIINGKASKVMVK